MTGSTKQETRSARNLTHPSQSLMHALELLLEFLHLRHLGNPVQQLHRRKGAK